MQVEEAQSKKLSNLYAANPNQTNWNWLRYLFHSQFLSMLYKSKLRVTFSSFYVQTIWVRWLFQEVGVSGNFWDAYLLFTRNVSAVIEKKI